MDKKICIATLPCININNKEIETALESVSNLCDIFDKIIPGEVSEKDLSIDTLQKFSISGDIFYSKCNEDGKHIADFIFKTFTKLAATLVRGKIDQASLDELNQEYISVLRHFVKSNQSNDNNNETYLKCC